MTKMNLNLKNKFYAQVAVFLLSGVIMIGHGARMIYQGVFQTGSSYAPNTFDIFFDWASLLILGVIVLLIGIISFYHKMESKQHKKSEMIVNPS